MMLNLNCPCKDCEERHIGCHSDCSKYIEAKPQTYEVKKAAAKGKEADFYISSKVAAFKDLKDKGRQIGRRRHKK